MARIRRHETVELATGGWLDLKGCEVLWAAAFFRRTWWYFFWPGGLIFARKGARALLLRTPKGNLISKDRQHSEAIGPGLVVWREVSPRDAFLWLQTYSRRNARRLFPEVAAQQREHMLAGER